MTNNKSIQFTKKQQEMAAFAKVFSHPARIAIIELLAKRKEIKTGNISDFLPLARTTVSQHLRELKALGIIKGTIDGLKVHYCLNMETLEKMRKMQADFYQKTISSFMCNCE